MSKDIAHRLVAWPVADRRALLKAYDELREAAREMDCYWCRGSGKFLGTDRDCDRCADLRRLLG